MGGKHVLLVLMLLATGVTVSGQDSEEAVFLNLINDFRQSADSCWNNGWLTWPEGAKKLTFLEALSQAARNHNAVMLTQNCFAHVCAGEPSVPDRVNAAGYTGWRFLSENIAWGTPTAQSAFDVWKDSDGHMKNMLHCRARAIGIARLFDAQSALGWVWTTDFGDVVQAPEPPTDPDPPAPPPIGPQPLDCFVLDANGNNRVDDDEVLAVIALWISGGGLCS